MARGSAVRRSRCDENGKSSEEAVKRVRGEPEKDLMVGGETKKKGKKARRRSRGKGLAVLNPINENIGEFQVSKDQDEEPAKCDGGEVNLLKNSASPGENTEGELSSPPCKSPETEVVEHTVIWSNAAFCSDQFTGKTPDIKPDPEAPPAGIIIETLQSDVACSTKMEIEALHENENREAPPEVNPNESPGEVEELKPEASVEEQRKTSVRFDSKVVNEKKNDEEEVEQLEVEIEKEIELLTRRLAELRAKREAKHKLQERAKRAISCPPTPISTKPDSTPGDSKCRKGRIVSAKFLQWQTKTPGENEARTSEKRASAVKKPPETGTTPSQAPREAPSVLQRSLQKLEITPRGAPAPRNKVIEKLQGGAGLKCLAQPRGGGSFDGGIVEQMRSLSLSPASSSDTGKRFDWTKSLRSATLEKTQSPVKSSVPEVQLLVDLKENKAAARGSPVVSKKVRNVASRYSGESPSSQPVSSTSSSTGSASRKRSLESGACGGLQTPGAGSGAASSNYKKRASLDLYHQQKCSFSGASRSSSRLKPSSSINNISEALKTPVGSNRKHNDGLLESERKKLPGLMIINRDSSPRDSGCVKRASQQKSHFFSTESWN